MAHAPATCLQVDKHQEAFLAQQAKGHGAAEGVPMEAEPPQGGQGAQVADEQQVTPDCKQLGEHALQVAFPPPPPRPSIVLDEADREHAWWFCLVVPYAWVRQSGVSFPLS